MSIARDMCGPSLTWLELRLTAQLQQRDQEIERLRDALATQAQIIKSLQRRLKEQE